MKSKMTGVTLLELMVALSVLSILAFIAIPSAQTFSASSSQRAATDQVLSAIEFARSEAITKGQTFKLCKHQVGSLVCDENNASWNNGWSVYRGATVIRTWDAPRAGAQLADQANDNTGIEFSPTGMANKSHVIVLSVPNRGNRCITINFNGRAAVEDC